MPGGPGTGQSSTPNSLESLVRAAEKDDLLLYLTAFCGVVMPGCVYVLYHYIHKMYSEYSKRREQERLAEERARSAVTVFFASEGNEGERVAHLVAERLAHESPPVVDLSNVDVEDFSQYMGIGVFVVNSIKGGREPESVEWFFDWLEDVSAERKSKRSKERGCRRMHFAVLGIDNSVRGHSRYNRAAKTLARRLRAIGAKPLCGLTFADRNRIESVEEQADAWADRLLEALDDFTLPEERSSTNLFGTRESSDDSSSADSYLYERSYEQYFSKQGHEVKRRSRLADENEEQSDLSESESVNRYTSRGWTIQRTTKEANSLRLRAKRDEEI
uniref:Flavodoxin-like domain-containing protein n=1 Tax=Parascaris univalens TaxID=6257 RepID=A0A915BXU0_PARUN